MNQSRASGAILAGIFCGMGAGALWGLVFLAPEIVPGFSPLEQAIGRYLAYGLMSVLLVAPRWRAIRPLLTPRILWALAWLALAGNLFYYVLLVSAVQMGGIAMTSLVVGFLPVAVTIVGSRQAGAVPLRHLAPSLLLCVAGALCIGWQAIVMPGGGAVATRIIGFACAVGALISWTAFAIGNAHWLRRMDGITSQDWNFLIGLATGAQALLFLPLAQSPVRTALNKASPTLEEAARTLGASSFAAFCRVTLPIIFPAMAAAFALVFLDAMKELTATLLLSPTGMTTLATEVWAHTANVEFAAAAPYAALLIVVSGLPVYLLTTRMYLNKA